MNAQNKASTPICGKPNPQSQRSGGHSVSANVRL